MKYGLVALAKCRFTGCLTHWSPRNRPARPAERVFFAGTMAYGCNLGLTRMAYATKRISPVSWQHINLQGEYDFSDEALTDALRFDLCALLTVEWENAGSQ